MNSVRDKLTFDSCEPYCAHPIIRLPKTVAEMRFALHGEIVSPLCIFRCECGQERLLAKEQLDEWIKLHGTPEQRAELEQQFKILAEDSDE